MSLFDNGGGILTPGAVTVKTTSGRGFTAEEWADRCLMHIIHVGEDTDSVIKDQAIAYKEDIRKVLVLYMNKAIKSDRTTLYNILVNQGQLDMAEILRKQL